MSIREGTKVRIMAYAGYNNRYAEKVGVVFKNTDLNRNTVGIKFDDISNPSSSYGVFWFPIDRIEIIESEEKINMLQGFKVAAIKFLDGTNTDKEYFYALYDNDILVGDMVVVKTGHHGFALAEVSAVREPFQDLDLVKCGREIVSKVDTTKYTARCEKAKYIYELKVGMQKKANAYQQLAMYRMIAENDPEMMQMLTEYENLLKSGEVSDEQ